MITATNLTKKFDGVSALENVTCTIQNGCIYGMVGSNGAGKSTFLRVISGVYKADGGEALLDGEPIYENPTAKAKIAYVPDELYYLPAANLKRMGKMYDALYPDFDWDKFNTLVRDLDLPADRGINTFSKGMRRQAYMCLALAIRPKYLLLDEAFDGLDPLARKRVKLELIKMVEQEGATVIISSHAMRELEDFCDTFAIIDGKTVKSTGDIADKVEKYCKFQLAFIDPIDDKKLQDLPIVSLEKSEKFVKVVLEGQSDEMLAKLEALSPAFR